MNQIEIKPLTFITGYNYTANNLLINQSELHKHTNHNLIETKLSSIIKLPLNKSLNNNTTFIMDVSTEWLNYISLYQQDVDIMTDLDSSLTKLMINIVACLLTEQDGTIYLEYPETGLHPKSQYRFGEFIAKMVGSGIKVVIYTHSEHIIDGVQLGVLINYMNYSDVVINFIKDEFDIQYIYLNESAELSAFPRDFMDQARQSIVELIRLRKEKRETKM